MVRLALLAIATLAVAGCSSTDGQLSAKDDKELRHNFARSLTPEEVAMMGKAKPAGAPKK